MKKISATLLDYGMCNMLNVARALEHVGADLTVTENIDEALSADRLIIPGVGSFSDSMKEVRKRGVDNLLLRFIETDRPLLGICVGMQILFEGSHEFGMTEGIGILPGVVKPVPDTNVMGERQRVPHIGWNILHPHNAETEWRGTLLEEFENKSPSVYFVHSFAAEPREDSIRVADCIYGGHRICAVVKFNNISATQFHPERSGAIGLGILETFLNQ